MKRSLILVLMLTLFPLNAWSQDTKSNAFRVEVSPMVVLPMGDFGDIMKTSFGVGGLVGYDMQMGKVLLTGGLQTQAIFWSFENDGGADISVTTLSFLATARAGYPVGKITPYGSLGVGVDMNMPGGDLQGDTKTTLAMEFGAGANFALTENIELGAGLKYHLGLGDSMDNSDVKVGYLSFMANAAYRF